MESDKFRIALFTAKVLTQPMPGLFEFNNLRKLLDDESTVVREAVQGVRRRLRRFGSLGVVVLVMGVALMGVMRSCNEPAPPPAEGGP